MNNGRMMWAWLIAQSSNLDKNGETLLSSLPSLAGLFILAPRLFHRRFHGLQSSWLRLVFLQWFF